MRRRISKDLVDSKRSELSKAKGQRDKFRTNIEGKDTPFLERGYWANRTKTKGS